LLEGAFSLGHEVDRSPGPNVGSSRRRVNTKAEGEGQGWTTTPEGINSRLIGRVGICDGLAKALMWISLVTQGLDGAGGRIGVEAEHSAEQRFRLWRQTLHYRDPR
jgi:hypothetical protein